jgi:hypothetical protein
VVHEQAGDVEVNLLGRFDAPFERLAVGVGSLLELADLAEVEGIIEGRIGG